jgi:hypothetical protein
VSGRRVVWTASLAAAAQVFALGALLLMIASAGMSARAEAFFSGVDFTEPVEFEEEVYNAYNNLYIVADALRTIAQPLMLAAIAAAFVLLAVLAQQFDARGRTRPTTQAEASTAS